MLFGTVSLSTLPHAFAATAEKPKPKPRPTPASPAIIVLDAGHGGKDPGAIGRSGTEEKHVTLAICQAIRSELAARGGIKAVLTRNADDFLPLPERVRLAHEANADFFVSIHADAAPSAYARGLSAYTLSDKASDAFSASLAKRENAVDAIYGVDLSHTDKDTAAILMDLARRHSHNASLTAQRRIVNGVGQKMRLLENPMRSANFAVLRSASVPSVLVETGFLTNRDDENVLRDPKARLRIAKVLADQLSGIALDLRKV